MILLRENLLGNVMNWLKNIFENNQKITFGILKKLYPAKGKTGGCILVEKEFVEEFKIDLERLERILKFMQDAKLISIPQLPGGPSEQKKCYNITEKGVSYFSAKSLEKADKYFIGWVLKHISIISIIVAVLSLLLSIIALCH